MNWDPEFIDSLLEAEDFRQFLACFFKKGRIQQMPKPLSFQAFANLAGFSSKSYLADVIAGRKRLTRDSFDRTAKALKLNQSWRDYLFCLIALDNEKFRHNVSVEDTQARLAEVKKKLKTRRKVQSSDREDSLVRTYLQPEFPEVYAALGSLEEGASLLEIHHRTGMAESSLVSVLREFEKVGLVEIRDGRYFPILTALEAERLQTSSVFRDDYTRSLSKVRRRLGSQLTTGASLFMTQTFSVQFEKLPQFKKELSRLVTDFADRAEDPQGDGIAEICIGFTHNK